MEAAVEALLAFGEARARVSGGAARFPGSSGPSGAGAGGRDQILSDELLAMQLQEELLREGELPRPPDLSEALGGLWGSVSAAATDLGNLAVTTGRAVAEGVSSVAVNLLSEEGVGGGTGAGAGAGAGAGWSSGAERDRGEEDGSPLLQPERERAVERTGLHRRARADNKKDN